MSVYRPWNWVFVIGIYIDDIDADFHRSLTTSACGLLGAALLLMTVASLMNRSRQRALGGAPEYAVTLARRIAANDVSGQVRLQGHDATSLLHAMDTMQRNLAGTINEIRGGADLIATASSQVTAGNLALSARTESQASSLEETAASMEQLTRSRTPRWWNRQPPRRAACRSRPCTWRAPSAASSWPRSDRACSTAWRTNAGFADTKSKTAENDRRIAAALRPDPPTQPR